MSKKKIIGIIVICVIAAAILVGAGIVLGKKFFGKAVDQNESNIPAPVTDLITWQDPQPYERLYIFILKTRYPDMSTEEARDQIKYYKVGTVNKGLYQGGDVVVVLAGVYMGPSDDIYRVIRKDKKIYLLTKYSSKRYQDDGLDTTIVSMDDNFNIPDLEFPENINVPDKNQDLILVENEPAVFFSLNQMKQLFNDEKVGSVYTNTNYFNTDGWYSANLNCFFIKAPDSTAQVYYMALDFVNGDVPDITWNSGSKNTQGYKYQGTGSCSHNKCFSIGNVKLANLAVAGKNSRGEKVYTFKNKNAYQLKSFYADEYYVPEGETKLSYSAFVAQRPLVYWKDIFGRFVEFKSMKFMSPAECGKPAVYLYPEKPTAVSVTVAPNGGITKSIPDYAAGWNVLAMPSGKLLDFLTAKVYPYLFWEGNAENYVMPKKGFVIEGKTLASFFDQKLTQLGLNNQEIADFKDYWLPKMGQSPYFFVTFVDQKLYELMAPMKVSPRPTTTIRVMMDYRPLQEKISVEPLKIVTPERKGFTVVEWGGMLHGSFK
jgi:hypothetical protein